MIISDNRPHLLLALLALISATMPPVHAQKVSSFEGKLKQHSYSVALVVPSSSVDEYPLFSPDLEHLGYNSAGKWKKVSLTNLNLTGATWLGKQIGYVEEVTVTPLKKKELESYLESTTVQQHMLVLNDKTIIELKANGISTALQITTPGHETREIWSTGMEPCFNLAIGANQNLVAFMCPMSGILVMDVKRTIEEYDKKELAFKALSLTEQGEYYGERGEMLKAISVLNLAVAEDPNDEKAHLFLGYAYSGLDKHAQALESYIKSNSISPSNGGYYNIGNSYFALGEYKKSISGFSKAIELDEADVSSYYNRGRAYLKIDNKEKACHDYQQIRKLSYKGNDIMDLENVCD